MKKPSERKLFRGFESIAIQRRKSYIFRMHTLTRKIKQDDGDDECSYLMYACLFAFIYSRFYNFTLTNCDSFFNH